MRQKTITGDKAETRFVVGKNGETSSSITAGQPAVMKFNATDDGIAAVLPATGGASKATSLLFGVAAETIAANATGHFQCEGFCRTTAVTKNTRAATTDSWTSQASVAVGMILNVDTVNNAFLISATSGVQAALPAVVLAESIASQAASASATSDTRTVVTSSAKTFLRIL